MKIAALLVAPLFLLAGCSMFFGFNAFSSLDKPPAPKLSDYAGPNGLSKLASDLNSPAIVAALTADPTTTQQIESWLQTQYPSSTPPALTAVQLQAAALYSDLNLKTTAGEDLVNNIIAAIMTNRPSGNLAEVLQLILPPSALADQATFSAMVNGLLNANTAYMLIGNSLPPAPPGMNMGDIAQKAAVCYLMHEVVSAVAAFLAVPITDPSVSQQMFLLATNQTNTISGVTVPDPFPSNPAWLVNIFTAAGATYPT